MTSATAVTPVAAKPLPQTSHAFELAFAPAPTRVGQIRRITSAFLELWNVSGPLAEDIVLTVSELVTNAVEHGKGDIKLRVRYADHGLHIEVTDDNPASATLRPASNDDVSGRGLLIVTVLAHKWGTSDDGKTTWCRFHFPERWT